MRRGKYEKVPIPAAPVVNAAMCLALVLFALVAVTVYLAQGLYARYVTQDTGSDSARVMKFGQLTLMENGDAAAVGQSFTCIPGVDLDKDITVSFTPSESDVFVLVAVDTTGWTTDDNYAFGKTVTVNDVTGEPLVTWSVCDDWQFLTMETAEAPEGQPTQTCHVYYTLVNANHSLTDKAFLQDGKVYVRKATRAEYAAIAGQQLHIQVTAYAVQANGFAGTTVAEAAEAAWDAVKN